MDKREDRLIKFFKQNNKHLSNFHVFKAVDGMTLEPSQKIQRLFEKSDHYGRRGLVGCAMSHMKLWKMLASDPQKQFMIILEDDIKLTKDFNMKILNLIHNHRDDFEMLVFHWNPYPHIKDQVYATELKEEVTPTITEWSKEKAFGLNMGSNAGYVLSKKGAYNLLRQIDQNGCIMGIDWEAMKCSRSEEQIKNNVTGGVNRVMYASPMMGFVEAFQNGNTDSNIQNVFDKIDLVNGYIEREIAYWKKHKINPKVVKLLPETVSDVLICDRELESIIKERARSEPFVWYLVSDKIIVAPWNKCPEDIATSKTLGVGMLNQVEV